MSGFPTTSSRREREEEEQAGAARATETFLSYDNEPILLTFLFITNHVKIPSNLWLYVPVYIVSLPLLSSFFSPLCLSSLITFFLRVILRDS